MRALQPPFADLVAKIAPSGVGSASEDAERNSSQLMIFLGCFFVLMGIFYLFNNRMHGFGIAYILLGIMNVLVSIRRLQNLKKRLGDNV